MKLSKKETKTSWESPGLWSQHAKPLTLTTDTFCFSNWLQVLHKWYSFELLSKFLQTPAQAVWLWFWLHSHESASWFFFLFANFLLYFVTKKLVLSVQKLNQMMVISGASFRNQVWGKIKMKVLEEFRHLP